MRGGQWCGFHRLQASWQVFSDFLSLAEILCLLIHLSQSSKGAQWKRQRVCVLLRNRGVGGWGDQRKQDANESALINVCLISYSALSGHRKIEEEAGRECWEEFMRKCRPNLWFTPFVENIGSQELLSECRFTFLQTMEQCVVGFLNERSCCITSLENNNMLRNVLISDCLVHIITSIQQLICLSKRKHFYIFGNKRGHILLVIWQVHP